MARAAHSSSGLTLSAAFGVRDANEASWTQVLESVGFVADAVGIPDAEYVRGCPMDVAAGRGSYGVYQSRAECSGQTFMKSVGGFRVRLFGRNLKIGKPPGRLQLRRDRRWCQKRSLIAGLPKACDYDTLAEFGLLHSRRSSRHRRASARSRWCAARSTSRCRMTASDRKSRRRGALCPCRAGEGRHNPHQVLEPSVPKTGKLLPHHVVMALKHGAPLAVTERSGALRRVLGDIGE
jgi:hypothetical protein